MKIKIYYLLLVLILSVQSLSTYGNEASAEYILFNMFGVDSSNTKILKDSVCQQMLYENSIVIINPKQSDEYNTGKLAYKSLFISCQVMALKFKLNYTSEDGEARFCDKKSFDEEMDLTIKQLAKAKPIKNQITRNDLDKLKEAMMQIKPAYNVFCEKYIITKVDPKPLVEAIGVAPNIPQENINNNTSRPFQKTGPGRYPAVIEDKTQDTTK